MLCINREKKKGGSAGACASRVLLRRSRRGEGGGTNWAKAGKIKPTKQTGGRGESAWAGLLGSGSSDWAE